MGNVNQTPQQYSQTAQERPDDQESLLSSSSFTCEICIEEVLPPHKKFNNDNKCIHPFCTECMIKYIQVKLEENISDIKCPALTCDHSLDPLSCRPRIGNQVFDKWCDVLCDSTVLGFVRVYCPYLECSSLVINECGGDLRRCVCPNCKKLFCFRCKIPWHAGYRCDERGEIMDQNDVAFGVLLETKQWMRCPVCRQCIERVEGCNRVLCRCGVQFCYKCGRKMFHCTCHVPCWMFFLFFCMVLGIILFLYTGYRVVRSFL
ncbi:hypothetical protein QVD17_19214 [Tagetes erecta]|uniref:RBR-type E3 ubiquitin transferase n=1 Tax=Tagetes erecta TaxID=13708 RepID=A0AAD8NX25_TARER|nr:hypothetical protein QVD17_19214 [Tagetes erecta]